MTWHSSFTGVAAYIHAHMYLSFGWWGYAPSEGASVDSFTIESRLHFPPYPKDRNGALCEHLDRVSH